MNKDLKFLLKRAFDAGTMYEATLSEECSFNEFIKQVEKEQLSICDVVKPLKHKESLAFEEMLKDKYIRINDNLFQNRNYHYRKTRKELLEMYNAIGQLL